MDEIETKEKSVQTHETLTTIKNYVLESIKDDIGPIN